MDAALALLALDLSVDVELVAYVHAVLALLATVAWGVARARQPFLVAAAPAPATWVARRDGRAVPAAVTRGARGRAPPGRV